MKALSDLVKAQKNSNSLRTTVPKSIVEALELTEDSKLEWEPIIRDNKIIGVEVRRS